MYFLRVNADFSAALYLSDCDEKFKVMHGHDFKVTITLCTSELINGMVYDYSLLKESLEDIASSLDHVLLNDKPAFLEQNPSLENICKYFYDNLTETLINLPVYEIEVSQFGGFSAIFRPTT